MEIGERILNLRKEKGLTQAALADKMGISVTQLSRIEGGKTATLRSDMLILLSKSLDVSSDYLLGLSPFKINFDCAKLELSEDAAKILCGKKVNKPALNLLIEHPMFPYLTQLMDSYFSQAPSTFYFENPAHSVFHFIKDTLDLDKQKTFELTQDMISLKTQMHKHENPLLTEVKDVFESMMEVLRNQHEHGIPPKPAISAAQLKEIFSKVSSDSQKEVDQAAVVKTLMSNLASSMDMGEKSTLLFCQLMGSMKEDQDRANSAESSSQVSMPMLPDEARQDLLKLLSGTTDSPAKGPEETE